MPAPGVSETASADHSGSEIVPVWPSVVVADDEVKLTVPKSVSGSGVHCETEPSHADGASAIHSALEMSGLLIVRFLENDWPVVSLATDTLTAVPSTVTCVEM